VFEEERAFSAHSTNDCTLGNAPGIECPPQCLIRRAQTAESRDVTCATSPHSPRCTTTAVKLAEKFASCIGVTSAAMLRFRDNSMPNLACPSCAADASQMLDLTSAYVNYSRCKDCGHVWSPPKSGGAQVMHVTGRAQSTSRLTADKGPDRSFPRIVWKFPAHLRECREHQLGRAARRERRRASSATYVVALALRGIARSNALSSVICLLELGDFLVVGGINWSSNRSTRREAPQFPWLPAAARRGAANQFAPVRALRRRLAIRPAAPVPINSSVPGSGIGWEDTSRTRRVPRISCVTDGRLAKRASNTNWPDV
jgi:hypothetical protein